MYSSMQMKEIHLQYSAITFLSIHSFADLSEYVVVVVPHIFATHYCNNSQNTGYYMNHSINTFLMTVIMFAQG